MVLLNYEKFIEERLEEQSNRSLDPRIVQVCRDPDFKDLMIKMYEYCQQMNIVEQRMDILAKETEKIKGIKPQLLDSQVIKIEQKTKQISSVYSIFLFKQPKFKVRKEQAVFYEALIKLIILIMQKCFSKQDFIRLRKQINRLIRTNSFNKKICWDQYVEACKQNTMMPKKKKKLVESDFRRFRFSVLHQNSEIRPYVNNRSCFRTKMTRSPIVSLLYPTNQYLSFKLSRKQKAGSIKLRAKLSHTIDKF